MARSNADAFLEAILANPDDDTPRLIYADWLDDQGDPSSTARAEFIRIQCALAKEPSPPRSRASLERRQRQLLDEHGREWTKPMRGLARGLGWNFHRGFIDRVSLQAGRFLFCAKRLFRRAPIQHVHLWRGADPGFSRPLSVPELADSEYLRRLRSLDLHANRLESAGVCALAVSEHLTELTSLNLALNRIGDRGIRALAEAPLLARLTHLDLSRNDFGPSGVRALAVALVRLSHSAEGLRMQKVDLSGNNLGTAGHRLIRETPVLWRVICPVIST